MPTKTSRTASHDASDTGSGPADSAITAVFYKLKASKSRCDFLARAGLRIVEAKTSIRTVRLARELRAKFVVLDASVGSNGPEKVIAALEDADWGPIEFLWAGGSTPDRFVRRASKMGATAVHTWPEGIFSALVAGLEAALKMTLRVHERVLVDQRFGGHSRGADGGRLVNLSPSGALVEFDKPYAGERFHLDFSLSDTEPPITVTAGVVRRQPKGAGETVALHFLRISPRQQRRIREFVRQCNVVLIEDDTTPPPRARVRVRVGAQGQARRDHFLLDRLTESGALLVPRQDFVVPFAPGMEVELDIMKPRRKRRLTARIVRAELVDPQRLDSPTGWLIHFDPVPDLQTLDLIYGLQAYEREAPRRPRRADRRNRE